MFALSDEIVDILSVAVEFHRVKRAPMRVVAHGIGANGFYTPLPGRKSNVFVAVERFHFIDN